MLIDDDDDDFMCDITPVVLTQCFKLVGFTLIGLFAVY